MRISGHLLRRQIAGFLVVLLVVPFVAAATPTQQEKNPSQAAGGASSGQDQPNNSGGSAKNGNAEPSQPETLLNSPGSVRSQTIDANQPSKGQQFSSQQRQYVAQEPVGAATAPLINTTGVAASKPAGAAIAPAKQRRSRTILISVGALLGAGVAVGTVMALSSGSPSQPPAAANKRVGSAR